MKPIKVTILNKEREITPLNWLHAALLNFLNSDKDTESKWIFDDGEDKFYLRDVTFNLLRPLYKAKQNINGWIGYLFNSDWNRDPNLDIPTVFIDKMGYVVRLGCNVASAMVIPVSYITGLEEVGVFWLKDRGHLFECVFTFYSKEFLVSDWNKVLKKERLKITKGTMDYKNDDKRVMGVTIIDAISSKLKEHKRLEKNRVGTSAGDCKISLETICALVPEFGEYLNNNARCLEVTKESLWQHIREIWYINNLVNKWMVFQNALLNFKQKVYEKLDKTFLSQALKLQMLVAEIDQNEAWRGATTDKKPKYVINHKSIRGYRKKVTNYEEIVPLRTLALDTFLGKSGYSADNKAIWSTERSEEELTKHLTSLFDNKVEYEKASEKLELYSRIVTIGNAYFSDFNIFKDKLLKDIKKKNPEWNTTNIEHCNILHEQFGIPVIIGVSRILNDICDGRNSKQQIRETIKTFCENMTTILEDVSTDNDFIGDTASMGQRFENVILPAYLATYDVSISGDDMSKKRIKEHYLDEIKDEYFSDSDGKKYNVLKLKRGYYNSLPEICIVNYDTGDGFDLGQKVQTAGYTLENCFIQQKYHNRSENEGNHIIDNLPYAKWFVEEQWAIASTHKSEMMSDDDYSETYFDIKRLAKIFKVID